MEKRITETETHIITEFIKNGKVVIKITTPKPPEIEINEMQEPQLQKPTLDEQITALQEAVATQYEENQETKLMFQETLATIFEAVSEAHQTP